MVLYLKKPCFIVDQGCVLFHKRVEIGRSLIKKYKIEIFERTKKRLIDTRLSIGH